MCPEGLTIFLCQGPRRPVETFFHLRSMQCKEGPPTICPRRRRHGFCYGTKCRVALLFTHSWTRHNCLVSHYPSTFGPLRL